MSVERLSKFVPVGASCLGMPIKMSSSTASLNLLVKILMIVSSRHGSVLFGHAIFLSFLVNYSRF